MIKNPSFLYCKDNGSRLRSGIEDFSILWTWKISSLIGSTTFLNIWHHSASCITAARRLVLKALYLPPDVDCTTARLPSELTILAAKLVIWESIDFPIWARYIISPKIWSQKNHLRYHQCNFWLMLELKICRMLYHCFQLCLKFCCCIFICTPHDNCCGNNVRLISDRCFNLFNNSVSPSWAAIAQIVSVKSFTYFASVLSAAAGSMKLDCLVRVLRTVGV